MSAPYERELPDDTKRITTGCQYCAVGCGYNAFLRGSSRTPKPYGGIPGLVTPAMLGRVRYDGAEYDAAVLPDPRCDLNRGNHSVRGGSQGLNLVHPDPRAHQSTKDRLTSPQVRGADGQLHDVPWEVAIDLVARLTMAATDAVTVPGAGTIKVKRPEGLGVKIFEYQYLENTYAASKLFYAALGTPNVAYHDRPSAAGSSPGISDAGFRPHDFSYDDVRAADIIVMIGTNPYENQSVFFMQNCIGRKIVVIDPRRTATANYAAETGGMHIQPTRLGADSVLLYALSRAIIEYHGAGFEPFLDQVSRDIETDRRSLPSEKSKDIRRRSRVSDFAGFKKFLMDEVVFELDNAAEKAGLPKEELESLVTLLAPAALGGENPKVALLYEKGLIWGFNYHNTAAVACLGLLLGSVGDRGRLTGRVGGHQKGWATCRAQLGELFESTRVADPDYAEGYPERNATDEYIERTLPHWPDQMQNTRYKVRHNLDNHVFGPPPGEVVSGSEEEDIDGTTYVRLANGLRTRRDPDVRLLWIIGSNYLGQTNDAQRKLGVLRQRLLVGGDGTAPCRPDFSSGTPNVEDLAAPFLDRIAKNGIVLVHQEIYPNPTTTLCDIVLPAAGWGEDTFCRYNAERRLKLYERFQDPPRAPDDQDGSRAPRSDWAIFADVARKVGKLTSDSDLAAAVEKEFSWMSSSVLADEMATTSDRADGLGLKHLVDFGAQFVADLRIPPKAGRLHTVLGKGGEGTARHLRDGRYSIPEGAGGQPERAQVYQNGVATNGVHVPVRPVANEHKITGSLRVPRLGPNTDAKRKFYFPLAYWWEIESAYERFQPRDGELFVTNGRFNHLWNNMFNHVRNAYVLDRYPRDLPGTVLEINPTWAAAQQPAIRNGEICTVTLRQDGEDRTFTAVASLQPSVPEQGAFALFSYPIRDGEPFSAYANNLTDGYQDGLNAIGALKYARATVTGTGKPWESATGPGLSYAARNDITPNSPKRLEDWAVRELVVIRGLPRMEVHRSSAMFRDPDDVVARLRRSEDLRERFFSGIRTWMRWRAEGRLMDAWGGVDVDTVASWIDGPPLPDATGGADRHDAAVAVTLDRHGDKMAERRIYRIHPSVGIARMGTSAEYFIGPEAPTLAFLPDGGDYRDAKGELKRQAQRFRVYEFTYSDGSDVPSAVREITKADADIKWSVYVANEKSFRTDPSQRFPIGRGPVTLEANHRSAEVEGDIWGSTVRLASLRRDNAGRLLVLGSSGKSGSLPGSGLNGLRNPGWWDDAGDGPVRAWLTFPGGTQVTVEPAWVVVGLPAYAAPVINLVTLYDLAVDQAYRARLLPGPSNPSFTRDIYPILRRTVDLQWVSKEARIGHAPGQLGDFVSRLEELSSASQPSLPARERVWWKLKRNGGTMPTLTDLDLTSFQYAMLELWKDGAFTQDWVGVPTYPTLDGLPVAERPAALDRGAMDSMVGGSFRPGIEVCEVAGRPATWGTPLRIAPTVTPGDLTRELAVPWQTDFVACGTRWWPAGRPVSVKAAGTQYYTWLNMSAQELLSKWPELGFLKRHTSGEILEEERQVP